MMAPRTPPKFVPTLTEVVRSGTSAASRPEGGLTEEQLVQRVMQRVDISLERRLRSCMTGVRAQAYDYGSPELVALELYLMSRARGLPMETPAVRP